jgi:hypothetical protein
MGNHEHIGAHGAFRDNGAVDKMMAGLAAVAPTSVVVADEDAALVASFSPRGTVPTERVAGVAAQIRAGATWARPYYGLVGEFDGLVVELADESTRRESRWAVVPVGYRGLDVYGMSGRTREDAAHAAEKKGYVVR